MQKQPFCNAIWALLESRLGRIGKRCGINRKYTDAKWLGEMSRNMLQNAAVKQSDVGLYSFVYLADLDKLVCRMRTRGVART